MIPKNRPVEKELQEQIEERIWKLPDSALLEKSKAVSIEGLHCRADEKTLKVMNRLVEQAREAHDLVDVKMAFEVSKKIQRRVEGKAR